MAYEIDWKYITGFFDGEGHVSFSKFNKNSKRVRIGLTNTNLEVLETIKSYVGFGNIVGGNRVCGKKPVYEFALWNRKDCLSFAYSILPYSIVKQKRLREMITFIEQNEWIRSPLQVPREELYDLYWIQGLSCKEIAERYECDAQAVLHLMKGYDLPRRTVGKNSCLREISKVLLHNLYWVRNMSLRKLARYFGYPENSKQLFSGLLRKYQIPVRPKCGGS